MGQDLDRRDEGHRDEDLLPNVTDQPVLEGGAGKTLEELEAERLQQLRAGALADDEVLDNQDKGAYPSTERALRADQRRAWREEMKQRAADIRKDSVPNWLIDVDTFLVRGGSNNTCFYATRDGVGAEPEHPTGGGFEFSKEVSKLNTGQGGSFELNAPINKVMFEDRVMNPKAKFKPPSMVDHYPLMMKQPPTILTAQYKSVLGPLLAVIKSLVVDEEEL
jgi:hypothetical protein